MEAKIIDVTAVTPIQRLKVFSGVISLAMLTILALFMAAKFYSEAEAERVELKAKKDALAKESMQKLNIADDINKKNYAYRNEIEDVYMNKKCPPEIRKRLKEIYGELTVGLEQTTQQLKGVREAKQSLEDISYHSSFSFSLVSVAAAEEQAPQVQRLSSQLITSNKQMSESPLSVLYLSIIIISTALFACCWILIFSTNADKVKFAQTTIHSIVAFAIGAIAGPALAQH